MHLVKHSFQCRGIEHFNSSPKPLLAVLGSANSLSLNCGTTSNWNVLRFRMTIYTPEIKHRYPKLQFFKGVTFSKPSFLVSMFDFRGCRSCSTREFYQLRPKGSNFFNVPHRIELVSCQMDSTACSIGILIVVHYNPHITG